MSPSPSEIVTEHGELVPVERAPLLLPMDVVSARQAMTAYQETTRSLLTENDWQGAPGEDGSFVKRSGWSKMATFYGVSTEIISKHIERDEDDQPVRCEAVVRASSPDGRRQAAGDGACSIREARFASPMAASKIRQGKINLEHDIGATAVTRATNRAISNLIGFGAVSAEEVGEGGPTYGPVAGAKELARMITAVAILYDDDAPDELFDRLRKDAGGTIPKVVARAIQLVASYRPNREPAEPEAEPDAAADEASGEVTEELATET